MPVFEVKHFFIFYSSLVLLGVVYLLWRKPRVGMRLKLGGRTASSLLGGRFRDQGIGRELNVIFNYNGHSWDAFEVLGIPAGSSKDRVENAFQDACQRVESESRPFLEAAYQAIRAQKG